MLMNMIQQGFAVVMLTAHVHSVIIKTVFFECTVLVFTFIHMKHILCLCVLKFKFPLNFSMIPKFISDLNIVILRETYNSNYGEV